MEIIPKRNALAIPYRVLLQFFEKWVKLPNINPSFYNLAGIGLSILYLYTHTHWLKIAIIFLICLFDWFDGATARRHNKCSRSGYIIDNTTDRVSEAFIFTTEAGTVLGQIFYVLWLCNLVLAFFSVYSNKHTSLPLRFAFMLLLLLKIAI